MTPRENYYEVIFSEKTNGYPYEAGRVIVTEKQLELIQRLAEHDIIEYSYTFEPMKCVPTYIYNAQED